MPRKPESACLFCDPDPCSCGPKKPAKKAAPRKKAAAPPSPTMAVSTSSPVDLKAAMAAAASPLDPPRLEKKVRTTSSGSTKTAPSIGADVKRAIREQQDEGANDEREMVAAMAMIEPLLHPDERAKYREELNSTIAKGVRWRREV